MEKIIDILKDIAAIALLVLAGAAIIAFHAGKGLVRGAVEGAKAARDYVSRPVRVPAGARRA